MPIAQRRRRQSLSRAPPVTARGPIPTSSSITPSIVSQSAEIHVQFNPNPLIKIHELKFKYYFELLKKKKKNIARKVFFFLWLASASCVVFNVSVEE